VEELTCCCFPVSNAVRTHSVTCLPLYPCLLLKGYVLLHLSSWGRTVSQCCRWKSTVVFTHQPGYQVNFPACVFIPRTAAAPADVNFPRNKQQRDTKNSSIQHTFLPISPLGSAGLAGLCANSIEISNKKYMAHRGVSFRSSARSGHNQQKQPNKKPLEKKTCGGKQL